MEYIIRLGEISLKGQNRKLFTNILRGNIREKFKPYNVNVFTQKGRFFVKTNDDIPSELAKKIFDTTFGIDGWARCYTCKKDIDEIKKQVLFIAEEIFDKETNVEFKVAARREDKAFELNSYQIECLMGSFICQKYKGARVNVKNPKYVFAVEIRENAHIYISGIKGRRGLPVWSAGKALSLLSGGIDSPVAIYKMASRGLHQDFLYFHAYPYTGDEALDKVKKLASIVAPYNQGGNLYVVNFTPIELLIKEKCREEERTLILRASMMVAAVALAKKVNAEAIVTGEALSQVASQTLGALNFTNSFSTIPVLRPLIGMDKKEIVDIAIDIGTFETSILPFDDCCKLFSPKHPLLNPKTIEEIDFYKSLNFDSKIQDVVNSCQKFSYSATPYIELKE